MYLLGVAITQRSLLVDLHLVVGPIGTRWREEILLFFCRVLEGRLVRNKDLLSSCCVVCMENYVVDIVLYTGILKEVLVVALVGFFLLLV